eukprot:366379-Chlamydomonas_euryale.AAC.2
MPQKPKTRVNKPHLNFRKAYNLGQFPVCLQLGSIKSTPISETSNSDQQRPGLQMPLDICQEWAPAMRA